MTDFVKVQFYEPDVGYENLWTTDLGKGLYRIESVPFFVYGISKGDVVSAERDSEGWPQFTRVETVSRNRTLRARTEDFTLTDERAKDLIRKLASLGCITETREPRLIAIDVPAAADFVAVTSFLTSKSVPWEYVKPTHEQVIGEHFPPHT